MKRALGLWTGLCFIVSSTVLAPAPAANSCPDVNNPKTCRTYSLLDGSRWPSSRDGKVWIKYFINHSQPWMQEADVVKAIRTAFQTWASWNPRLQFIYGGVTDKIALPGDGLNVIDFGPGPDGRASVQPQGKTIKEVDITFAITTPRSWDPCSQRDNSCTDGTAHWMIEVPDQGVGIGYNDLQSVATHEIGHLLGLSHPDGSFPALTMSDVSNGCGYCRRWNTLGLGDILGAKALYPWSCPRLKPGQRYPYAYRYLCPTIKVFAP